FAGAMVVPLGFVVLETVTVLAIAVVLLGAHFELDGVLTAVLALPPTLGFYAALGAVSASFIVLTKRGDPVTPIVTRLTNFLAGALFPVAVLPGALEALAHLLPPLYALEVLRAGLINGESIGEVWGDYLVLLGSAAVSLPLA